MKSITPDLLSRHVFYNCMNVIGHFVCNLLPILCKKHFNDSAKREQLPES